MTFATYGLPATAQMTWLDAAGNAIKHTRVQLTLYVGTPPPGSRNQLSVATDGDRHGRQLRGQHNASSHAALRDGEGEALAI
jgi:hypothetical protein